MSGTDTPKPKRFRVTLRFDLAAKWPGQTADEAGEMVVSDVPGSLWDAREGVAVEVEEVKP